MKKSLLLAAFFLLSGCQSTSHISTESEELLASEYADVHLHKKIDRLIILGSEFKLPDGDWEVSAKEHFGSAGVGYILSGFENYRLGNTMTVYVARPDSWIDSEYGNCSLKKLAQDSNAYKTFIQGDLVDFEGKEKGCWTIGYAGFFGGSPSSHWSQDSKNSYSKHLMYARIRGGEDPFTVSHQVKPLEQGYILIVTYGRSVFIAAEYNVRDIFNGNVTLKSDYIEKLLKSVYEFDSSVQAEIERQYID